MKARTKKAPSINLHSEKYIRILQILETKLKRNRKENPSFYYSPSRLSSMIPPCSHDSHHLFVLYTSQCYAAREFSAEMQYGIHFMLGNHSEVITLKLIK